MRRIWAIVLAAVLVLIGGASTPVAAQEGQQPGSAPRLTIFTRYPSQMAELGESVTFDLVLDLAGTSPQVVRLDMREVPEGWTATFSGGGRVIQSVYVEPSSGSSESGEASSRATVSLKLEPPPDVAPGAYRFVVAGESGSLRAELPIELTVKEKLPSSLAFDVELPTLKGTPSTTFRYDATLKNEGDEELTINLGADAPEGFQVRFMLTGQEVTSFPLGANETKNLDIEVTPPPETPAGQYQINVVAEGSDVREAIALTAEVTGQPDITVTTPDERLSREATAGRVTPIKIVVQNTGSAPARNVELSASPPSGWSVRFEPERITEIPPQQQVEVTANVSPAEKAIAGDYMLTVRAQPEGGTSESVELRITVLTSTLWGIVGVAVIAVAVGVVGLAVARFGRR